ncbi:MAG: M20/M25/M40 family metallo-hydrolase [Vulcanimicrobiota bacterium]
MAREQARSRLTRLLAAAGLAMLFACPARPSAPAPSPVTSMTSAAPLAPDPEMVTRLKADVEHLAAGERNLDHPPSLPQVEKWLTQRLESMDYQVKREEYQVEGSQVANLVVEIAGAKPEVVVIGAHYDSAPGTRGADDNASGVASLLELARQLRQDKPEHTLRLVLFVNEEPPWFMTEDMGSLRHARGCKKRGEDIRAMVALESIGYFSDEPDSQHFPPGIEGYPTTGNFVGFVGNLSSAALVSRCKTLFAPSGVAVESLAAPSMIEGVGWSDHWSFWQEGYPAVMLTDTAPFRNPNYHRPSDLPDTLDYHRLAQVTTAMLAVVRGLTGP